MWDKIEHNGYEVWVLPIPAYGPPAPDTLWHYSAYICRHGAQATSLGRAFALKSWSPLFPVRKRLVKPGMLKASGASMAFTRAH